MSEYFAAEYGTEATASRAAADNAAKYKEIRRTLDAYRRAVDGMNRLGLSLVMPE